MTPGDRNILNTLSILVLLFRARKRVVPKLTEEQQHTLTVTQEYLGNDNLPPSVFLNSLTLLDQKGYLANFNLIQQSDRDKLAEFYNSPDYEDKFLKLKSHDADVLTKQQKQSLVDYLKKVTPPGYHLEEEKLLDKELRLSEFIQEAKNVIDITKKDIVATVVLYPFRSIERLLEKMNAGHSFDDVADGGIWYDSDNCKFHIGENAISTIYQTKPNVEHYVLQLIPENLDTGVIWYDEIESRGSRSIKDALRKFVAKDDRLSDIFTIHANRLEFDIEAF